MTSLAFDFLVFPYAEGSFLDFSRGLVNQYGGVPRYFQEPSGSVADAENKELALGRDVALNTYADYTAGANWTNPSGELARHGAGSVETLQQNGILAVARTYQATVVMSNRTAGSITITDGGVAIDTNGTTPRTITSTGTDFIITPTSDFDGDIDVAITLVQQTNILASSAYPGAELLIDGDMEAVTTAAWTAVSNAILTKETTNPHSGSRVIRVAYNGTSNPAAKQTVLTIGKRYRAVGWCRGDATYFPRVSDGAVFYFTGTTSTDWQPFDFEFVAQGTSLNLSSNVSAAGYVEYDEVSTTEVNPLNADHTGVTVGQVATNDLGLAVLFDGANDYTNQYSAELNSMLDPSQGELGIFAKVSGAGVWTDNTRRVLVIYMADANNYISLEKNTSNELEWNYVAGGTAETIVLAVTPSDYFYMVVKWGANMQAFYNGVQTGSDQAIAGTFVGNLNAATTTVGAASTVPASVMDGYETQELLLRNAATDAETLKMARLGGVA